ncbi:MAG TPA: HAD-IB family hydrolase [Chryseosolibacter sp.]|nr:HAD-IB family hydrolase [Chryseosolibacter sp.]
MISRVETKASTLVLFDFDGTITYRDTLVEFARFYAGSRRYLFGLAMLTPVMALYAARLIANWKAKQYFLGCFFRGEEISYFNSRCLDFSTAVLPSLIRPAALAAIEQYQNEGATIAVVSASAENWVKPWCDTHGLLCLATQLEIREGRITGNLEGRNCYGDEKVCRIRERFNLSDYNQIIAYGDSSGDKEMLNLAHHRFYKPFREK